MQSYDFYVFDSHQKFELKAGYLVRKMTLKIFIV